MDIEQVRNQQINFLRKIEDIIPSSTSLVHELSEILEISTDSAYRRIRGETALSIYEVVILCQHFKVSFDSINSSDKGLVTFTYTRMVDSESSFKEFLNSILTQIKAVNKAEEKYVKYACEDIPVFYNYQYPELSAFKMFYWMKSILNASSFQNTKFSLGVVPTELTEIGKEIAETYLQVPSVEIWTETTVVSTIKQIEYYWESGQFESVEIALAVCSSLRKEIEDIQKQAECESKLHKNIEGQPAPEKNYTLYFSDIEITNNCVLLSVGEAKNVFLGHHTFNTIVTPNASYCEETEEWLNNIIKKSILISGVSEKLRYQYFNKIYKQIDALRDKIEGAP